MDFRPRPCCSFLLGRPAPSSAPEAAKAQANTWCNEERGKPGKRRKPIRVARNETCKKMIWAPKNVRWRAKRRVTRRNKCVSIRKSCAPACIFCVSACVDCAPTHVFCVPMRKKQRFGADKCAWTHCFALRCVYIYPCRSAPLAVVEDRGLITRWYSCARPPQRK